MIRHYSRTSTHNRLAYDTAMLWENMISPLCGIMTRMYVYHRQAYDPRGIAIGGELTNVALFKGITAKINYHIGGMGINREEAMIKCLAEAYERYIPVFYDPERFLPCCFKTYDELVKEFPDDIIPSQRNFQYFSETQYTQNDFFTCFHSTNPMLWVKTAEMTHRHRSIWLPAQLLFFGYLPKRNLGENRINSAVSTGTAVHRNLVSCIFNSFLEMTMIDASIGHWYTDYQAYKIEMTSRTRHIAKILKKSLPHDNIDIEFYYIPSIDVPIFNIACLARSHHIPKFSIGLGSDSTLEGAMYKAFIEFIGTRFLSNTLAVLQDTDVDPNNIQNLDENVLYYALGNGSDRINIKFNPKNILKDTELLPDLTGSKLEIIQLLQKIYFENEKYIAYIDFTNSESKQLDLVAAN